MLLVLKAIDFATNRHAGQVRKASNVPYITHPVAVSYIVASSTVATSGYASQSMGRELIGSVSLPGTISFVISVGPIALAMGVPIGPLALLVAVEMMPDIMRTIGNVTADVALTAAVDRKKGEDAQP